MGDLDKIIYIIPIFLKKKVYGYVSRSWVLFEIQASHEKKKNNVAKEGQAFEAIEPGELSLSTSQFSHIDTNIGNPKFEVLLGGHWEYIRKCVVVVNTEEMQWKLRCED